MRYLPKDIDSLGKVLTERRSPMGAAGYTAQEVTHEYGEHKDISWLAERDNAKSIKNMFHIFDNRTTDWREYTCSFWCAEGYLLARGPIQLIGSHVDCECV